MLIQVVDNLSLSLLSVLEETIAQSQDSRIAVAFVSMQGLRLVESALRTSLQAGAHIEFLVGMDGTATDPEALWFLYKLALDHSTFDLYCYIVPGSTLYHPKLYVMRTGETVSAIVGSSNLTEGGLKQNFEINLHVRAGLQQPIILDIYSAYSRLKFLPNRVEPDEELIGIYEAWHRENRRHHHPTASGKRTGFRELQRKLETLQGPRPTQGDLVGWLRLIYDLLPSGEFTNQDIYAFEPYLQERYPSNKNIRAKIRQQLQLLRDMGLVEHLEPGRWRKR